MARSLLVIEFRGDAVRAGVFKSGKAEPVEFIETPRGDGPASELKTLMDGLRRRGFKGSMRTFVSIDPALASLRVVDLPFSDKAKLDEVMGFEAQDIFLKDVDELAIASRPMGPGRAIAAAVDKAVLRELLKALKEASIDPEWIGLSMLSKDGILIDALGAQGTCAFIDDESMAVVKDGAPFLFKRITDADDLRLAIAALEEEGADIGKYYAAAGAAALLDALGIPYEASAIAGGMAGVIAVAMHVSKGFKDGVNFRSGEFADTAGIEAARRGLNVELVLVTILVVVFGAYAFLKNRSADASLKRLNSAMEGSYRELFPGEGGAADFSYRLEAKLKALRDEIKITGNGVDVAETLSQVALAAGRDGSVRIYEARISGGKIIASGETSSFDGAERFRDSMSRLKYFKEITLADVKSSASGGVNFNITAVIGDAP